MLARSDWSTVDQKLYLYDLKEALNYIKRNYPPIQSELLNIARV